MRCAPGHNKEYDVGPVGIGYCMIVQPRHENRVLSGSPPRSRFSQEHLVMGSAWHTDPQEFQHTLAAPHGNTWDKGGENVNLLVLSPPPPRLSESKPCSPRSLPVGHFSRRFSPVRPFLPAFLPGLSLLPAFLPDSAFLPEFLPVSAHSPGVPPRFGLFSRCSSRHSRVRNNSISQKERDMH